MAIINRVNKGNLVGTVIAVDPLTDTIQFCYANNSGSALITSAVDYKAQAFDKAFFKQLGEIVKQQAKTDPQIDLQKVYLLLPDQMFLLDTLVVPVIHRKAMQQSLSLAVEAIYQNAEELNLMTYAVQQNKQAVTFGLVGIRHDVLNLANTTLAGAGAPVNGTTFPSNAMVNGAMALNAKLRGDTFLLLDIQRDCSRFAFVVRGCTMGYYDLPFGYGVMHKSHVVPENTLLEHHAAKTIVLNSKEKARAKQEGVEAAPQGAIPGTEAVEEKKLPRFMQRPTPENAEGYVYENFRVFLKWALELINNNPEITSLAKIDTVYVNMPDEYRFLFDVVNEKHEGRDVTFVPLLPEGTEASFVENLTFYGGFFTGRYNEANTF